jgi:hypothetical protein
MEQNCDWCNKVMEGQAKPFKNACQRPSTGRWCSTLWVCRSCADEQPSAFKLDEDWADFYGDEWEG